MQPTHAAASDGESEGEEEVLETWKVTDAGKIMVVPKTGEQPEPATVRRTSASSKSKPSKSLISSPHKSKKKLSTKKTTPKMNQQLKKQPTPTPTAAPIAPRPTKAAQTNAKAIWYLGGNHLVKLLTSVDGDLDQQVLSKVAAVPSVVGELALSVECLVSDDFTVGGFEDSLLAKIASNTLAAKRASGSQPDSPAAVVPQAPGEQVKAQEQSSSQPQPVPNPLASYKPVPNPLARITPPASPVATFVSEKRKESPTSTVQVAKRSKISMPAPAIKAR